MWRVLRFDLRLGGLLQSASSSYNMARVFSDAVPRAMGIAIDALLSGSRSFLAALQVSAMVVTVAWGVALYEQQEIAAIVQAARKRAARPRNCSWIGILLSCWEIVGHFTPRYHVAIPRHPDSFTR